MPLLNYQLQVLATVYNLSLPGQRCADLQSWQGGNDFHGGAAGFHSWKVVQQTVTEDPKDCGVVTCNTGSGFTPPGKAWPHTPQGHNGHKSTSPPQHHLCPCFPPPHTDPYTPKILTVLGQHEVDNIICALFPSGPGPHKGSLYRALPKPFQSSWLSSHQLSSLLIFLSDLASLT